jgi:hypothetical protein
MFYRFILFYVKKIVRDIHHSLLRGYNFYYFLNLILYNFFKKFLKSNDTYVV